MTIINARTVTSVRREFEVTATAPLGAAADELSRVWMAAEREYRERHQIPDDTPLPGDAFRFIPGSDCIVITFTVEETTTEA